MKRTLIKIALLFTTLSLAGCGMSQGISPGNRPEGVRLNDGRGNLNRVLYAPAVPPIPPNASLQGKDRIREIGSTKSAGGGEYGLILLTRNDLDRLKQNPARFNRQDLAQVAAQALSSLPHIGNASILVTDDHLFVGYTPSPGLMKKELSMLDRQVRQSVASVLPPYYDVITSTDEGFKQEVMRIATGNEGRIDEAFDRLLQRKGLLHPAAK